MELQGSGSDLRNSWKPFADKGYERLGIVVDSGASVCMLPRDIAKDHVMVPGKAASYTTAGKGTVQKEGEKTLTLGLQDGTRMQSQWEVGNIHRPLCAVSRLTSTGHKVVFDKDVSYIENKSTGRKHHIFQRGGVYVLPAWVDPAAPFGRQGGAP